MRIIKTFIICLGLVTAVFGTECSGITGSLKFRTTDGKKISLEKLLKQGPLAISFWATWCHPCQEELKHLQNLHQVYADSGIGFLAVSIDEAKNRQKVKSLISGKKITLPVALDPEQEAMKAFGLTDVPGLFILDQQGNILYRHLGYKPGDELMLEEEIKKIIQRPAFGDTLATPESK
ncbi:TlpA family protein disulfide reductase [candidate division TA06 bacterium]|uniref:TlpA family protein disulfide reductase n=1 Tax=candidate division TA06 bacterium TaxID=2250710 RepID=A0A933MKG4_UNCT6|nr:TlpA family protein disulfide reductase [candidate division TA06 bacterium]